MRSAYEYENNAELTHRSQKPARKSIKSGYLHLLHWQFLIVVIVLYVLAGTWIIYHYGVLSLHYIISIIFMALTFRILVVPCFHILKGYMAATTRMILSLVLSMLILTLPVFSWSLWEQGVDQTQNNAVGQAELDRTSQAKNKAVGKNKTEIKRSPETTLKKNTNFWSQSSPLSHVEFKLIPYARVFDITDHSRPKLILDSHYATVRMKKGGYRLQFEYGNKRYQLYIHVGDNEKYTLFFDLNRGLYNFYRSN